MMDLQIQTEQIDTTAFFKSVAARVHKHGMSVPAVFFLESMKPLSRVLHAATMVSVPILSAIFGAQESQKLLTLLESRENVENLIQSIEAAAHGS
jgi:hypothetical protein